MANNENLKPFKKGPDPRRNLRGVPKDAIEARKFFRRIGAELLKVPNSEEEITRLEALVRLKFGSRAPKDFETILKAMFPGLLKDEVDVTSGGEKLADESAIYDRVMAKIEKRMAGDGAEPTEGAPDQPER